MWLGFFSPSAALADVKVHGATTVTYGLMKLHQAKIEQMAGVAMAILPSSTTRGLIDLAKGAADIAMLAEPLETAAASVNKKEPGLINLSDFVGLQVGSSYVRFIVHPDNPVKQLSKKQLAGLFSGAIKNWSEVGGPNLPVLLVGEPTSSPHKLISQTLGISYPADMRVVQNTNQTAIIVAQAPGALSYISTSHVMSGANKPRFLESDVNIALHLYLAYRKDAPGPVRKVVEAAAAVGK